MSYHTPSRWDQRCTHRDPYAAHQIIILMSGNKLAVACNCRPKLAPFATIETADQAWRAWRSFHGELVHVKRAS
jgi:hypothetical protein